MAPPRAPDSRRLDVAAFAAAGEEWRGEWEAARLRRVQSSVMPAAPGVEPPGIVWRVLGERAVLPGAGVRPSLLIEATTEVTLECQRCLQPMRLPLQARRRIFFVEGEDAAAALDADSDDDVLALTPTLDLETLIEDELLLALPIVPRHDICTSPLARPFIEDDGVAPAEDNPFAALAALKRSSPPN